jgi:hypothetical protein
LLSDLLFALKNLSTFSFYCVIAITWVLFIKTTTKKSLLFFQMLMADEKNEKTNRQGVVGRDGKRNLTIKQSNIVYQRYIFGGNIAAIFLVV